MATASWLVGSQVLLRLRGYISVWLALQVSHSDVVGVGLGGVAKRVVPSHSPSLDIKESHFPSSLACQLTSTLFPRMKTFKHFQKHIVSHVLLPRSTHQFNGRCGHLYTDNC